MDAFPPGQAIPVDTIGYKGKLWLVPEWIDTLDGKLTKPTRIVCLDGFPVEKNNPALSGVPVTEAQWVLTIPVPRALLTAEKANGVEIVLNPDIQIRRGQPGDQMH